MAFRKIRHEDWFTGTTEQLLAALTIKEWDYDAKHIRVAAAEEIERLQAALSFARDALGTDVFEKAMKDLREQVGKTREDIKETKEFIRRCGRSVRSFKL